MKDYNRSQKKWPSDGTADEVVEFRGEGESWASAEGVRVGVRNPAEDWYAAVIGPRPSDHHVHARSALSKHRGHSFSPSWCKVIRNYPSDVVMLVTVHADGRVEPEGWLTVAEIFRRGNWLYEGGTRYITGPYNPVETFDPKPIPLPRPVKRKRRS